MNESSWAPPQAPVTADWIDTELLADDALAVSVGERRFFDKHANGANSDILLFGTGQLGRRTLAGLRRAGHPSPLSFVDNNEALHGTVVDGLPVLSPREAASRYGNSVSIVVSIWSPNKPLAYPTIAAQMAALGSTSISTFVPLFWKYQEEFLPYFCIDAPHRLYEVADEVKAAHEIFRDDHSRAEFRLQLSYLMSSMDVVDLTFTEKRDSYFPGDLFALSDQEVFVDCGAYDGDTLNSFLEATRSRFQAVVAFEPDPAALSRLEAGVRSLPAEVGDRVQVLGKAVGGRPGTLRFEGGGTPGSRLSPKGSIEVECVTLDTALGGIVPTFIKMDIEGAEGDALRGATQTIREHRPILAICVYHLQADLYRLPTLIAELCPDYTLFLRRQARDSDLVCFAVPNERLV